MSEWKPELLCPSGMFPSFFEHFLVFRTIRYSRLLLYVLYPSHGISSLSKKSWLFQSRMVFRNGDLDTKRTHCYGGVITSRTSKHTVLGKTYIYTHTRTHTHPYIYFSIHPSIHPSLYIIKTRSSY